MKPSDKKLHEKFVATALGAMIAKAPLVGTLGCNWLEKDIQKMREDICEAARKYADQMIKELNK